MTIPSTFIVSDVAGTGIAGNTDGPALQASFNDPHGLAVGPDGVLYVADRSNCRIRKIDKGIVSTVAGTDAGYLDGPAGSAKFAAPSDLTVGSDGTIYVADTINHRIRKIFTNSGGQLEVETIAGPGAALIPPFSGLSPSITMAGWADGYSAFTLFNAPSGIDIDPAGENLYITEFHRVRRVPTGIPGATGLCTTLAAIGIAGYADGIPTIAQFNQPYGVAVAQDGDVYVADAGNYRVRKITPSGQVSTVAGDGVWGVEDDLPRVNDVNHPFLRPALAARFQAIHDCTLDHKGVLWITDWTQIQAFSLSDGTITVLNVVDETGARATLNSLAAIAVASDGTLYVTEQNDKIRKLTPA
jgi:DNA-binding beta-propeller fold protein YncE